MARLFQEASGDYVAIHHDHDPTEPGWLDAMVGLMEAHPEAGMACCGCYEIADHRGRVPGPDGSVRTVRRHAVLPGQRLVATLATRVHRPLAATGSPYRREAVVQAGGYRPDWFLAADEDVYRRVASLSGVASCPIRLYTLSPRPRESTEQVGGWRGLVHHL
jgi:GT2 family glycosyltransferase